MKERVLKTELDFDKWKMDSTCSCDFVPNPEKYPCLARTYVSDWACEEETAEYLYRNDIVAILAEFDN